MALTPERRAEIDQMLINSGLEPVQADSARINQQEIERKKARARELVEQGKEQRSAQSAGAMFPSDADDTPLKAGLKSAGNVPSSVFNLGKGLFQAIKTPIQTIKGAVSAAKGSGESLARNVTERFAPEVAEQVPVSPEEEMFNQILSSLGERFGAPGDDLDTILDKLRRTATNDPVGFGADVIGVLAGGSSLARKVGMKTAPVDALTGVVTKTKDELLKPIVPKLDDMALSQMEKALNLNPSDIRRIERPNVANTSPQEWLLQREISGSQRQIAETLADRAGTSRRTVVEGLEAIDEPVIDSARVEPARQILGVLRETFENVPGNEDIVRQLTDLQNKQTLNLTDLQKIKELTDVELDIFSVAGDVRAGAQKRGLANLRAQLKEGIEAEASARGFTDVQALNKETQVAREIEIAIRKRLNVSGSNLELGIRDALVGMGGFVAGDLGTGLGLIAMKKVLESSRFRSALAIKLEKLSQAERAALETALQTRDITTLTQFVVPLINELSVSGVIEQQADGE